VSASPFQKRLRLYQSSSGKPTGAEAGPVAGAVVGAVVAGADVVVGSWDTSEKPAATR